MKWKWQKAAMEVAVRGKVCRRGVTDEGDAESGPLTYTWLVIRLGKAEISYAENGFLSFQWPGGEHPEYGYVENYRTIERDSAIAFVCSRRFLQAWGGGIGRAEYRTGEWAYLRPAKRQGRLVS